MENQNTRIKKIRQKLRKNWSDNETNIFIDIWSEHFQKLRKTTRNGHIMVEMAQCLEAKKINVNATEVLNKKNNLAKRYRSEKKQVVLSDGVPSEWPFYQKIHQMFESFKSNRYDLTEQCVEGSNFTVKMEDSTDTLFSDFSDNMSTVSTSTVLSSISAVPPIPSTLRAAKRKNNIHDQDEIKEIMDKCSKIVAYEMKRSNDLLAEANIIEAKKLKIIDNFVNANISFQKSIIEIFQQENK